jgi:hypothetical protein
MGSFRKKQRRRFSSLLLSRLPKAHTRPATVLIDELHARLVKGAPQLLTRMMAPAGETGFQSTAE